MPEKSPDHTPLPITEDFGLIKLNETVSFVDKQRPGLDVDLDTVISYSMVLQKLATNYGIANPGFEPIFDTDENGRSICRVISQEVTGHAFIGRENLQYIGKEITESTMDSIISFIEDTVRYGGDYERDMRLDQCMFGTTPTDPVPKVYFVDIDPSMLRHLPLPPGREEIFRIDATITNLLEDLDAMEVAFGERNNDFDNRLTALYKTTDQWYQNIESAEHTP